MRLLRSKQPVNTIFHLLGDGENDMTAALGFVLSCAPVFLRRLLKDVLGKTVDLADETTVALQTSTGEGGITDVEVLVPGKACMVIEAKRGVELPSVHQLRKYAPVIRSASVPLGVFVAITNATPARALKELPREIDRIPVVHRSWRQVKTLVEQTRPAETHATKRFMDDFVNYLEELMGMETRFSNMVYVVSLGSGNPEGWGLSWIDIVEKKHRYFYPVGGHWPPPPNYLGFRYDGKLQSIHHVRDHEVFTDPHDIFSEAPSSSWGPHYCFKLGPAIKPAHDVRNGPRIHRSARCSCMLDTLLTCPTISDALTETERRKA